MISRRKHAIILTIAAMLTWGCASKWTAGDTYRHATFTGLMMADYLQTLEISRNPDKYYERNPILGNHPSQGEVTAYFAGSYALVTGAAMVLPAPYRDALQYVAIGVEAGAVANNFSIGLRFGIGD